MSEDNKKPSESSIDEILKEFQARKNSADNQKSGGKSAESQSENSKNSFDLSSEIKPPKPKADFSAQGDALTEITQSYAQSAKKESPKEPDNRENENQLTHGTRKKSSLKKPIIVIVAVLCMIAVAAVGIFSAENDTSSTPSYISQYEKKYPSVDFPSGILEKYCDLYGENPNITGYLEISDINLETPVLKQDDGSGNPYAQSTAAGAQTVNYVVYLDDNSLEKYYSDAEAYNSSSGFIKYSNLSEDMSFKVLGAFYTNTKASDDNGYIFPYNATEKQTAESTLEFFDRLDNRFLYDTKITLTRSDRLVTISCPTNYRENFRFVVVGVLRDDSEKLTAYEKKSKIRYPQVIYDETGEKTFTSMQRRGIPK